MPVEQGCVTFKAAATATAASAAFPPFFSIEIPAFAANGWVQATQPCLKSTGEWPNMAHATIIVGGAAGICACV